VEGPDVAGDADLEIGLRWDKRRDGLDVNLRFQIVADSTDDWKHPDDPLRIDLGRLQALTLNEAAYGQALTDMILGNEDVGRYYERAVAATQPGDLKLHLRLHINAPPRFHALRWELLRDPSTGSPIATKSNVLLSRYLSSPDWRPIPVLAKHELTALIVVAGPQDITGFRPKDRRLAPVRVDEELARARAALAGFHTRELTSGEATLAGIMAALEEGVDVLYVVCHGALIEDVPRLYLEKPGGMADPVDGRRLIERLSDLKRRPTVVMLASCQSAAKGDEMWSVDEGELSALGPRMAAAGVAAVIAMQGNVSMKTAATFAPAFFAALARDGIVDEAMSSARRSIRDRPDWWVPVLFSRLRSGRTYYRPDFAERGDDTWRALKLAMETGALTPVLGPGLAHSILGSHQDIARRWVERWQMPIAPHNQGNLAQVAQYLRVRSAPGTVRSQLQEHLSNEISRRTKPGDPVWDLPPEMGGGSNPEPAILEVGRRLRSSNPGDPYRVMAALPVSVYVTTGWTDLLQAALRDRQPPRDPVTLTFPWNEALESRRQAPQPTVERPLVYHLFGRLEDPSSLVLSEDDYFAWLIAWVDRRKSIPTSVQRALASKTLLFLGYRLADWDFRVVFHGIKSFGGSALLRTNVHVGVQLSPENQMMEPEAAQEYLESYFGEDKVSIFWGNTRRFIDEFRNRTGLVT
jgi:hypothetical protein